MVYRVTTSKAIDGEGVLVETASAFLLAILPNYP
jgi:hypothetical protein